MNEAKIRLSPTEMELVTNAGMILTKNAILQKALLLLGTLQEKQQTCLQSISSRLPAEVINTSPKISRGENYLGLPYLVLDYPRLFDKENIFLIRSMFWWGNFFSITLHLSGRFKESFSEKVIAAEHALKEKSFYYCVNEDAWQHHFEPDNYLPVAGLGNREFGEMIRGNPFIKLSQKIPLSLWDSADEILLSHFQQVLEILAD